MRLVYQISGSCWRMVDALKDSWKHCQTTVNASYHIGRSLSSSLSWLGQTANPVCSSWSSSTSIFYFNIMNTSIEGTFQSLPYKCSCLIPSPTYTTCAYTPNHIFSCDDPPASIQWHQYLQLHLSSSNNNHNHNNNIIIIIIIIIIACSRCNQ